MLSGEHRQCCPMPQGGGAKGPDGRRRGHRPPQAVRAAGMWSVRACAPACLLTAAPSALQICPSALRTCTTSLNAAQGQAMSFADPKQDCQ